MSDVHSEGSAKDLYRAILRHGDTVLTATEALERGAELRMTPDSVYRALARLADRDEGLLRMSRGRYAVTDLATGQPVAHPFVLATAFVRPSAVSHWSALQHWHLTEQLPQIVFVSSPKRGPQLSSARTEATSSPLRSSRGFSTQRIVTIPDDRYFGFVEEWLSERDRVSIFEPERSVLDMFHHFHVFGSLTTALDVLDEHARDLDLQKLIDYALRLNVGTIIKRLGWSLEEVGSDTSLLTPLREFPLKEESPLDPGLPSRGRRNQRWQVIENLSSS